MQNIMIEEMETIAAPSDFTDFLTGVSVGIAVGLLIVGC
jgi:hypothetical protein